MSRPPTGESGNKKKREETTVHITVPDTAPRRVSLSPPLVSLQPGGSVSPVIKSITTPPKSSLRRTSFGTSHGYNSKNVRKTPVEDPLAGAGNSATLMPTMIRPSMVNSNGGTATTTTTMILTNPNATNHMTGIDTGISMMSITTPDVAAESGSRTLQPPLRKNNNNNNNSISNAMGFGPMGSFASSGNGRTMNVRYGSERMKMESLGSFNIPSLVSSSHPPRDGATGSPASLHLPLERVSSSMATISNPPREPSFRTKRRPPKTAMAAILAHGVEESQMASMNALPVVQPPPTPLLANHHPHHQVSGAHPVPGTQPPSPHDSELQLPHHPHVVEPTHSEFPAAASGYVPTSHVPGVQEYSSHHAPKQYHEEIELRSIAEANLTAKVSIPVRRRSTSPPAPGNRYLQQRQPPHSPAVAPAVDRRLNHSVSEDDNDDVGAVASTTTGSTSNYDDSTTGGGDDRSSQGSDAESSNGSGTSSTTRGLKAKSFTIKCDGAWISQIKGLLKILLIMLVPIGFLVAYTSLTVDVYVVETDLLSKVAPLVQQISDCSYGLMLERGRTGNVLAVAVPTSLTPNYDAMVKTLMDVRASNDILCNRIQTLAEQPGIPQSVSIFRSLTHIQKSLMSVRALVDARIVTGIESATTYRGIIVQVSLIIETISADDRIVNSKNTLNEIILHTFLANSFGMCRGIGAYLLGLGRKVTAYESGFIARCLGETQAFSESLLAFGDLSGYVPLWQSAATNATTLAQNFLLGNLTTPELWFSTFSATLNTMTPVDQRIIERLRQNENGKIATRNELLKLFGAVLGCILASALLAWHQKTSQDRVEKTLAATYKLSQAVKRFVPKNQLRIMGVMSITEVRAGDCTEVAQTMLFSDIRGFTAISSRMSNAELFDWLQTFFHRMTGITEKHGGFVEKFIGDAIFCVFPAPGMAVRSGCQMQSATHHLNTDMPMSQAIQVGVGVHHGVVMAGVLGDSSRLTCTLIASDVNMASRLEGLTKGFGAKIIVSGVVMNFLEGDEFESRYLGSVEVQGASKPMDIYEVFNNDELRVKEFKLETKAAFEAAVRLQAEQPEIAFQQFLALRRLGGERYVDDKAVFHKLDGLAAMLDIDFDSANEDDRALSGLGAGSPTTAAAGAVMPMPIVSPPSFVVPSLMGMNARKTSGDNNGGGGDATLTKVSTPPDLLLGGTGSRGDQLASSGRDPMAGTMRVERYDKEGNVIRVKSPRRNVALEPLA